MIDHRGDCYKLHHISHIGSSKFIQLHQPSVTHLPWPIYNWFKVATMALKGHPVIVIRVARHDDGNGRQTTATAAGQLEDE